LKNELIGIRKIFIGVDEIINLYFFTDTKNSVIKYTEF